MRQVALASLICLLLGGCDKLTGAAAQKVADAEAIGYACRVSLKTPEACMKENEAQSPSSVLDGWKAADQDIKEKTIATDFAKPMDDSAAGDEKPAEDAKPADDATKPEDAKADAAKEGDKPADAAKDDANADKPEGKKAKSAKAKDKAKE